MLVASCTVPEEYSGTTGILAGLAEPAAWDSKPAEVPSSAVALAGRPVPVGTEQAAERRTGPAEAGHSLGWWRLKTGDHRIRSCLMHSLLAMVAAAAAAVSAGKQTMASRSVQTRSEVLHGNFECL